MPRDAAGNYTLPAGNPVVSATTISSSWANPTMEDIGNEMSQSLDRNGRGGMLVPFGNVDGAAITPGMTFTNEPNSGFYRFTLNDVRASIGGFDVLQMVDASAQPVGEQKPFLIYNGTTFGAPLTSDGVVIILDAPIRLPNYASEGFLPVLTVVGDGSMAYQVDTAQAKIVANDLWVDMSAANPVAEDADVAAALYFYENLG